MSIIFSQAVNAIKHNNDNIKPNTQNSHTITKRIVLNSNRNNTDSTISSADQSSILSRIKLNKEKVGIRGTLKKDLNLLSRKAKHNEDNGLFSIQKKTIKKDLRSRLAHNTNKIESKISSDEDARIKGDHNSNNNISSSSDVWKHDLYHEETSKTNSSVETGIFFRNLPENMNYNLMRGLFKDDEKFISGIKVFYIDEKISRYTNRLKKIQLKLTLLEKMLHKELLVKINFLI